MRYASLAALSAAALLLLLLAACDSGGESGGEDVGVSADTSIPSLEDVVDAGSHADVLPKVDLQGPDIAEDTGADVPAPPPDVPADVPQDTAPDTSSIDVPGPACDEGEPCDDGDPCTQDDVCADGVCAGTAYTCEDDLSCTADLCDGDGGCSFPLRGGYCLIGDLCYEDGAANPDNACQACIPPLSTEQWSAGPAQGCDDGDACTSDDTCRGGLCVGTAIDCGEPAECRAYHCDSTLGCVEDLLSDAACDDGDACTSGDSCQEGVCTAGSSVTSCDDGNDCTDDACDPTTGDCVHSFNTAPCNDHSVCTQVDVCVEGVCVGQQPLDCADENLCTDDGCHPMQGCIHVNNTDPCDDGDPCSVGDRCVAGSCGAGPGLLECTGDNPCLDYACVAGMGCVEVPNDNVCSDDNACTVGDHCAGGDCVSGDTPLDCVDGNLCTDDLCDPASGCYWEDNSVSCDDEDPCTVGDHCGEGACQPGADELECPSDGDPCTFNRCAAGEGCVADPLTGPVCDDDDPCTVGDSCSEGLCVSGGDELECVDDNACTANYCEAGVGCVVEPLSGTDCSDDDECTVLGSEHCEAGECVGTPLDCDDYNACTDDSCDPSSGCVNEASGVIDCWPKVTVDYPPRGATIIDGSGFVTVTGNVGTYAGGSIERFEINGETVSLGSGGVFSFPMSAEHGLNMIRVFAEDDLGVQRDVRQSYQYSEAYWPMDVADPEAARIDDGIVLFLSDELVDDHDRSDVDDLATIMEMMFASLDLNSMIPNPAAEVSEAGCDYEIRVRNVSHDPPALNLYLQQDALRLVMTIDDFHARVDAEGDNFWCPDADVDVDADRITVDATVRVTMVNGAVQATVISNDVTFQGMSFSDSNWLIDILIGLFEGTIEDELESAFEGRHRGHGPRSPPGRLRPVRAERGLRDSSLLARPGAGHGRPRQHTVDARHRGRRHRARDGGGRHGGEPRDALHAGRGDRAGRVPDRYRTGLRDAAGAHHRCGHLRRRPQRDPLCSLHGRRPRDDGR